MKKLLFCTQKVNKGQIRRENRQGVEHIILTSYTLPPNIVMNGGLYPSDEIDKSFKSLNRTPVTIEHPEINGQYVSANDPEIDMDYRFGAFNENARKLDDGRIALDKVINVQKAMKVERGKRLLDRINELETSDQPRPMHTSVGVFLDMEELDSPMAEFNGVKTNAEYGWVAKDMVFDHDAILLDTIGAATPEQGTGIGINSESVKVEHFILNEEDEATQAQDMRVNQKRSFDEIHAELYKKINQGLAEPGYFIREIYDNEFIYETSTGEVFKSLYSVDSENNLEIENQKTPVERVVEYRPINQPKEEDNAMRDSIIAELVKLGIKVNSEISDTDLMAKYNEALTANNNGDDSAQSEDIATIVANALSEAVKPLNEKIDSLESGLKANQNQELDGLVSLITNSDNYPGLDADTIKSMPFETVKKMASNCGQSYGIGSTMQVNDNGDSEFKVSTNVEELPE